MTSQSQSSVQFAVLGLMTAVPTVFLHLGPSSWRIALAFAVGFAISGAGYGLTRGRRHTLAPVRLAALISCALVVWGAGFVGWLWHLQTRSSRWEVAWHFVTCFGATHLWIAQLLLFTALLKNVRQPRARAAILLGLAPVAAALLSYPAAMLGFISTSFAW